jgi:hypothetical protein
LLPRVVALPLKALRPHTPRCPITRATSLNTVGRGHLRSIRRAPGFAIESPSHRPLPALTRARQVPNLESSLRHAIKAGLSRCRGQPLHLTTPRQSTCTMSFASTSPSPCVPHSYPYRLAGAAGAAVPSRGAATPLWSHTASSLRHPPAPTNATTESRVS